MNLKILTVKEKNNVAMDVSVLFNVGRMDLIRAVGTDTWFKLQVDSRKLEWLVDEQVDDVFAATIDYNASTTIPISIVSIDGKEINGTQQVQVDKIVYGYETGVPNYSILLYKDKGRINRYEVTGSLSAIESLANFVPERHSMVAGQTSITTTRQLPENVKIFKNGSYQGTTDELSTWSITGIKTLTYSGTFWGGEEIDIVRI